MIRRRFLGLMTLAGAGGATALSKAARASRQSETAQYKISGFTCVTCATGLETLLGREKGVLAVLVFFLLSHACVCARARQGRTAALGHLLEPL